MDSAEFLDLLGNANRRRILHLLAQKPCYVTEISEYLGVSPKAVIDHLRKLEDAGLVESQTDDRRRKYFSISRHVRLEVTVSPYKFGTKSAYPASSALDISACRHIDIDIVADDTGREGAVSDQEGSADVDVGALARTLDEFQSLERELSLAQRWTEGQIGVLRERLGEAVDGGEPRLSVEVILELVDGEKAVEEVSRALEVPPLIVEEVLDDLAGEGVVHREGTRWALD